MTDYSPASQEGEFLNVRLDPVLAESLKKQTPPFDDTEAVARALLRQWVDGNIPLSKEDVRAEVTRTGLVGQREWGKRSPRAGDKD